MNLSIFQQTNPVGAGNSLVAGLYKASAPAVLVASYQFPGPYVGATQLHTFTGLVNVVYNYVLYESPDGGADGTVRNSFSVQPNTNAFNVRDPLYLEADVSPFFNSGTNFYGADSSLIGWDWYLELVGAGTQHYTELWTKTVAGVPTTAGDITADGWVLTRLGDQIGPDERRVIHFLPQLAATSTPSSGTFISATTLLTSNTVLDATAAGQAFLLQGGGGFLNVTLPDIGTVPDNEPIFINSNGGSHINGGVTCFAGQSLQWYDNQGNLPSTYANALYLGQGEDIYVYRFTFPGGAKRWLVCGDKMGLRQVGEIVYTYSKLPLNTVFANGQYLSRTNYARLWKWVQNTPGILISDTSYNATITSGGMTYNINHGKFTDGDGSTTFRVPTLFEFGFMQIADGFGLAPGQFALYNIGRHVHNTGIADDKPHGDPNSMFVYDTTTADMPGNSHAQLNNGAGGNIYQSTTSIVGGPINSPTSYGVYALIRC